MSDDRRHDGKRRRGRLAGAAIDVSALRVSRPFRRVFVAQLLSGMGSELTLVALMYHVYVLTGSELATGALGLVRIVPIVVVALWGGAIADAHDRRVVLIVAQLSLALTSGALAALALLDEPPLAALYALAAINGAFSAIDGPTRTAVLPMLVPGEHLRSVVQLGEVLTQSGRVFGPLLFAPLILVVDLPAIYALDATTFLVSLALMLGLPSLVPERRRRVSLSSVVEGLAFVRSRPVLASTFWADLVAMILGMPRAVFPALALTVWNVGPEGVGLLYAAPAVGAVIGLGFTGLTARVRREGLAVLVSVSIWGAAIAAAVVMPWFGAALALLAVAGAADMVSAIFRKSILYQEVPDELRGRMSAVHIMVVTGGPQLGDAESGIAADVVGLRPSVVLGGLGCVAGMGVLAWRVPAFARWRGEGVPEGR